jgi:hypothetical protein
MVVVDSAEEEALAVEEDLEEVEEEQDECIPIQMVDYCI